MTFNLEIMKRPVNRTAKKSAAPQHRFDLSTALVHNQLFNDLTRLKHRIHESRSPVFLNQMPFLEPNQSNNFKKEGRMKSSDVDPHWL